jgi:hypothetical protein
VVEDRYYVEPEGIQLNEGDTVTLYHTKKGYYTVTESFNPELCDSDCFNSCYENCAYAELQDCYLGCTRGCACELCLAWNHEEVCYEYQNRIACSIKCYNTCYYSYDSETHTSTYEKWCGYTISEPLTLKDAQTGDTLDTFTLDGVGTASMNRSLPLSAGTYEIYAGSTPVGDVLNVASASGNKCRILIPQSLYEVTRGVNETLSGITLESDVNGAYTLSLERRDENQNPILPFSPSSLQVASPVTVTGGSGTFNLNAVNPQPVGLRNFWANLVIKAAGPSVSCEAAFDYSVDDGDGVYSGEDNCPTVNNPDQLDSYPPGGNGCGDACECHADCTGDQKVNLTDLVKMKEEFNRSNCATIPCQADCNYDTKVNLSDLVMMKSEFNRTNCPVCQ